MNVPLKGGLARTPQDVAQSVERLATAVSAGWNVEHLPDGRHNFGWTSIPFAESLYTADAGNWTLVSSHQQVALYSLRGSNLRLQLEVQTSSVTSTPTYLAYRLPKGLRATRRQGGPAVCLDNGTPRCVWWIVSKDRTAVRFYFDMAGTGTYATAVNTTSLAADMEFEVTT